MFQELKNLALNRRIAKALDALVEIEREKLLILRSEAGFLPPDAQPSSSWTAFSELDDVLSHATDRDSWIFEQETERRAGAPRSEE